MNKIFSFLLLFLTAGTLWGGKTVKVSDLILKNNARISGDVLQLDGKAAYAEIPGTENYNITQKGLTLACSVKLQPSPLGKEAAILDSFFTKPGTPFVFARYAGRLASNIRNEKNKITAKTRADRIPPRGRWTHVAVTYEYFDDTAQGETGFFTTLYLNGEKLEQQKHTFLSSKQSTGNIEIGKGYSSPWALCGEVAEIFVADRALSAGEIAQLAGQSKKRQISAKTVRKKGVRKISLKEADIFLHTLPGKGSPLAGMYDKNAKREVLKEKLFSWQIKGRKKNTDLLFRSSDIRFTVRDISAKGFTAVWKNTQTAAFDVISHVSFLPDGLTADLEIKNHTEDFVIKEVVYPEVRIPVFSGKDTLFYPYMCGAEIPSPARTRFRYGQNYTYPSANVSMQYSAYYAGGRGVFLGWQDPAGTIKDFSAEGKLNAVDMTWRLPAAVPLNKTAGGNSFRSPGKVTFRLFSGGWYEAAMLHKKWALDRADWGKIPLPRTDTPEWFKRVPCSIAPNGTTEKAATEGVDQLLFLQKYLEVPVHALWFNWYDTSKRGWPAFPPKSYTLKLFNRIMGSNCYIEPYTDGRLWDIQDPLWEKSGKPGTVKREDGSIYTERHGKGTYGVMCPVVKEWQQVLLALSKEVAGISSAVYHDQVSAARGGLCFDKTHGHALNDPAVWQKGYREIYTQIRKALPKHPQVSEDMAEPYIAYFDGGHVWRWGFQGAVPAFQAVYGGRIQYLALLYDKINRGEPESNFAKMAYSLVNGIKIGKTEVQELFYANEKRLFFKKLSHVYAALYGYFAGGTMLPPVKFSVPPRKQSLMWSGHWRSNEKVTTPAIESNSYSWKGRTLYIFVNPTPEKQSCRPEMKALWLCREGESSPVKFSGSLTLPPRSCAIAVSDRNEAVRIQKTLKKIAGFNAGISYDAQISFPDRPPLVLKKGELAGPSKTAGYFAALRAGKDGRFFGHINTAALISWGIVDFGSQKVDTLYLHAAIDKRFSGGRISILTLDKNGRKTEIGSHTMSSTGGWMKFKKIPVKLNRTLTGKAAVMLTFDRNGCCNLAGWEY